MSIMYKALSKSTGLFDFSLIVNKTIHVSHCNDMNIAALPSASKANNLADCSVSCNRKHFAGFNANVTKEFIR